MKELQLRGGIGSNETNVILKKKNEKIRFKKTLQILPLVNQDYIFLQKFPVSRKVHKMDAYLQCIFSFV